MKTSSAILALTAALVSPLVPSLAMAQSVAENDGRITDASGRSLYTFDKDSSGKSNCVGACATSWPPFLAQAGAQAAGDYSLVAREDGSMQWALKSKPLYYFAGDAAPGDVRGDGQGGVWHAVRTLRAKAAGTPAPKSSGYGAPGY
jgi:predicted lipoprotein with Yx(FWY)xxD motif